MKIDSTSIPHSLSVSSPNGPRDSAAAPNARTGQRRDFAERPLHRLQVPELSSRSLMVSFSFPDSTSIESTFVPRPNLSNLFEDALPLTRGILDSSGMSSSSHSGSSISHSKPPLFPSGYRTIVDNKTMSADSVQQEVKTHGTNKSAATGSVDMRPMRAVWNGENVITIVDRFGINSSRDIQDMEGVSIATQVPGFVKKAARSNLEETIASFAQQYGITTHAGMTQLRSTATQQFALREVENGGLVQSVIKQFSITDKGLIHQLERLQSTATQHSALREAENGQSAQSVVRQSSITDERSINQLNKAQASALDGLDLKGGNTRPPAPTARRALLSATPDGSSGLVANAAATEANKSPALVKNQL